MTTGVLRWPLHPRPGPIEALSSWLERIAGLFDLSVQDLLRHNFGSASMALVGQADLDLDWDPPLDLLTALDERTGLGLHRFRPMTMAGWVPWLTDTLGLDDGQAVFDTYVRQHSVLLKPGEVGRNRITRWRPWLPIRPARLACPVCLADPERGTALMWRVPVMVSCAEHGCRLEPESDVRWAAEAGRGAPAVPASSRRSQAERWRTTPATRSLSSADVCGRRGGTAL